MGVETTQSIQSTRGHRLDLGPLRGKTVVVFYEARDHVEANLQLKEACGLLSEGMRDRLVVLGVADVEGLSFVRPVVAAAVRRIADRYGAEIWMDFDGALRGTPFRFGRPGAWVGILDPRGELVFRREGTLDASGLEDFFAVLGASLDPGVAHQLAARVEGARV